MRVQKGQVVTPPQGLILLQSRAPGLKQRVESGSEGRRAGPGRESKGQKMGSNASRGHSNREGLEQGGRW